MATAATDLLSGCYQDNDFMECHFCASDLKVSTLSGEIVDRLRDLFVLRSLTTELNHEVDELLQKSSIRASHEAAVNTLAKLQNTHHKEDENLASRIDADCIWLAEESMELRREKELLAQLRSKREHLQLERSTMRSVVAAMSVNLQSTVEPVLTHRWRVAESLFRMIPIQAEFPGSRKARAPSSGRPVAVALTGSSQIMGLPLLNSGEYDGVPHELVGAALAHTAHLVDALATVFNVPLDHPLKPFETYECTICPPWNQRYMRGVSAFCVYVHVV